uniref:Putative secreted protein n=1 Tax=Ixodes ricinus TaxID=34613 RepID=V5GPJ8_IXORI
MRAVLLCYLLLVGVLVTDAQESCLDRRVLLKTGKDYLKSLLAKLVPESVRDFLRSLPPPDFKSAEEMQRL